MDFPRYTQWSSWTIEPVDAGKKPSDLKVDDKLKVNLKGLAFRPVVTV